MVSSRIIRLNLLILDRFEMNENSVPEPESNQPAGGDEKVASVTALTGGVDVEMDASLPADVLEACAMIHIKAGCDYPSYVPTGLIDSSTVSAQVVNCSETLEFVNVSSGLLEYVDKLKIGLEKYTGAVSQVMRHLKSISTSAKTDFDKNCENRLLENIGLPASQGTFPRFKFWTSLSSFILVPIRNRLVPSISLWYMTKYCDRGSKYLGTLASDRQSRLISALSVVANVQARLNSTQWLDNFNRSGVLFGHGDHRHLPSFCSM